VKSASLELVNAIFKNYLAALVDDAVYDACKREDTSDNAAHVDEELEKVLFRIRVLYGKRRNLIVEDDKALK